MAEQAAHLVDEIFPRVATRQWVLTWPHWLRFRLAFDATLLTGALKVWVKTVEGWYRKQARDEWGIADGKCASIQGLQRFGDALTLNPHIHSIFCEGVWYDADGNDTPVFMPLRGPTDDEVQQIAMDARRRTLLLMSDDVIKCWGSNGHGQLIVASAQKRRKKVKGVGRADLRACRVGEVDPSDCVLDNP